MRKQRKRGEARQRPQDERRVGTSMAFNVRLRHKMCFFYSGFGGRKSLKSLWQRQGERKMIERLWERRCLV